MKSSNYMLLTVLVTALMTGTATAQVTLKRGAVVYFGSAANTTAPATIDLEKVKDATEEWKKIKADGIDPDSARGKQLTQKMNKAIREAVKAVASDESRDLVVRKKDISDKQGREVVDLTKKVVEKIEE